MSMKRASSVSSLSPAIPFPCPLAVTCWMAQLPPLHVQALAPSISRWWQRPKLELGLTGLGSSLFSWRRAGGLPSVNSIMVARPSSSYSFSLLSSMRLTWPLVCLKDIMNFPSSHTMAISHIFSSLLNIILAYLSWFTPRSFFFEDVVDDAALWGDVVGHLARKRFQKEDTDSSSLFFMAPWS